MNTYRRNNQLFLNIRVLSCKKRNACFESGFIRFRLLTALALFSIGAFFAMLSLAGNTPSDITGSAADSSILTERYINAVACTTASDCWAVGHYVTRNGGGVEQTLIEHWDGTSWSIVFSPNSSSTEDSLESVTCTSASDCWAVGNTSGGYTETMVEHWDGTSWSIISSPNAGQINSLLNVTCTSASDCWAVGDYQTNLDGSAQTLIEHWDGTSWSIAGSPNPANATDSNLYGVTCTSESDCWAVGTWWTPVNNAAIWQPFIEHWDGTSWSVVMSPSVPAGPAQPNILTGVTCTSASDCWAVGDYQPNGSPVRQTLTEHWDGTSWSIVFSPNSSSTENWLESVTCTSASDCWAVGFLPASGYNRTLIEHWDGISWSIVTSPNTSDTQDNYLYGVACTSASDCWAVGYYYDRGSHVNNYYYKALFTHWDATSWAIAPSPNLVTIQTNPAGLTFAVDGNTYSGSQSFSWLPGSSHAIAALSPQSGGTGVQYVWSKWSDSAALSHTVAPTADQTYTATFRTQYYLTMTRGAGGSLTPPSGWKNSGAIVSITATPTNNTQVSYYFDHWTGTGTGSYSGTNNTASITMNGPITENATFIQNPVQVTVQTNPTGQSFFVDGTNYTSAQTFSWQPGSSHTIATTSPQSGDTGVQYVWANWSDGGTISHTVAPTTNKTYTANFRTQYYLTMSQGTGGTVNPASGWKNGGATVSITATPASGYSFTNWTGSGTGSFSGTNNPASITMGGPITETATFTHN
jgi:hypothetical protein